MKMATKTSDAYSERTFVRWIDFRKHTMPNYIIYDDDGEVTYSWFKTYVIKNIIDNNRYAVEYYRKYFTLDGRCIK